DSSRGQKDWEQRCYRLPEPAAVYCSAVVSLSRRIGGHVDSGIIEPLSQSLYPAHSQVRRCEEEKSRRCSSIIGYRRVWLTRIPTRPVAPRRTLIPRTLLVPNPEGGWLPEILRPPRLLWAVRNTNRRSAAVPGPSSPSRSW